MSHLGIDVAVGDEEVLVLVVVVIEKTRAKGQVGQARLGEAGRSAGHGKGPVAAIAVQGVVVVLKVGDQKVAVAVAIAVPIRDAHAGLRPALGTESGTSLHADVAELAVSFVPIEKIGGRVIGHVEV